MFTGLDRLIVKALVIRSAFEVVTIEQWVWLSDSKHRFHVLRGNGAGHDMELWEKLFLSDWDEYSVAERFAKEWLAAYPGQWVDLYRARREIRVLPSFYLAEMPHQHWELRANIEEG